jgi:hypothetical protein
MPIALKPAVAHPSCASEAPMTVALQLSEDALAASEARLRTFQRQASGAYGDGEDANLQVDEGWIIFHCVSAKVAFFLVAEDLPS